MRRRTAGIISQGESRELLSKNFITRVRLCGSSREDSKREREREKRATSNVQSDTIAKSSSSSSSPILQEKMHRTAQHSTAQREENEACVSVQSASRSKCIGVGARCIERGKNEKNEKKRRDKTGSPLRRINGHAQSALLLCSVHESSLQSACAKVAPSRLPNAAHATRHIRRPT